MSTITYTAAQVLAPESSALFDELVHLLDLSFADDPMTNWLFKNYSREEFPKKLTYYHRPLLRVALLCGARIIVVKEDNMRAPSVSSQDSNIKTGSKSKTSFKAIAILIPPSGNKKFESGVTHVRAGLFSLAWHAGLSPLWRLVFEFVPKLNKMVAGMYPAPNKHRKYDQWHLLVVAARPDCQGQGLGGTLISECQRIVRDAALKSKMLGEYVSPLYLESSTIGSKRLYNRKGFVDRGSMEYGLVKEGENVSTDEDGKIRGAKLFALLWTP